MTSARAAVGDGQPARPRGADHADADGVREAERIADGHDPIARRHLRRVAELHFRELALRLLGQLDERAVGQRIAPDHLGLVADVVVVAVEIDFDLGRAFDDVVVGEDEAVLADDEAGAGSEGDLRARLLPAARRLAAEEALEQVVAAAAEELGELLLPLPRLGPDVDDRRADGLRDVAERRLRRPARSAARCCVDGTFIAGCAIDTGDRSRREASTMPTASDATAISNP